jgi:hypothetical protein
MLRNAQGEPVVVPRAEYEEYERVMRQASIDALELPPPTLSQLDLLIEPQTDYAHVAVDAELRLAGPNPAWLAVPIGLPQLQWVPSTPGFERLGIVSQANGYVWRVEPGSQRARRLKLEALCKMTASQSGSSIRLDLPATSSVVRLRLPLGDWDLTASGSGSEVIEPFRNAEDHAIATVRTTANSLNLAWSLKQERQALTAVEATSLTKFSSSDDGSQIKAVTTWSLRGPTSLGGKNFSIALPANGRLRDSASISPGFAGYRVVPREGEVEQEDAPLPPLVLDIEVDESFARTDLDLAVEWQMVGPANPQALHCEVPRIDGVQAHSGTFECMIPRGIDFRWTALGDARMQRQSLSTDGSNSMVYAYRFASQPAGILAAWQSLVNRPRMRSSQQIDIGKGFASLQGRLDFFSDPTQLPLLQLEWSGWRLERLAVLPAMLEWERNSIVSAEDGERGSVPLNASWFLDTVREKPLASASPAGSAVPQENPDRTGMFSSIPTSNGGATASTSQPLYALEYTLSRTLSTAEESLLLTLPQLSWLNPDTQQRILRTPPGTLYVQSLVYRFAEIESAPSGLVPLSSPMDDLPSATSTLRLPYQVGETAAEVAWKAKRTRRPSRTAVDYEVSPAIRADSIEWNHRWMCRSLGGRPDTVLLDIPKEMRLIEIQVDGKSVDVPSVTSETDPSPPIVRQVRIPIPEPDRDDSVASEFLVTAISETALRWNDGGSIQIQADLPRVRSPSNEHGLVVESANTLPPRVEAPVTFVGTHTRFDVEAPQWSGIIAKKESLSDEKIEIEREWVQTILNAIYQRDRYVARFKSTREWIEINVESSAQKDLEILLDGKRVLGAMSPESDDRIRIPLPDVDDAQPHVLEVFVLRASPIGLLRKLVLHTPRLHSEKRVSPLIWQVVVPRTEHLVWNSPVLEPLYRWEWKDLFFARRIESTQRSMEAELGASLQPELESMQTNQYALATVSGREVLSAWFIPRSLIWLPVASVALLLAMSFGENAKLARPWLWVGFLAAWMIFSQWSWDVSLLIAQTTLAAMSLAIAYMLLRWLLNRRARRRSIFVTRSAGGAHPSRPRTSSAQGTGGGSKEKSSKAYLQPTVDGPVLEEGA